MIDIIVTESTVPISITKKKQTSWHRISIVRAERAAEEVDTTRKVIMSEPVHKSV